MNTARKVLAIVPSLSKRAGAGRLAREIVLRLKDGVDLTVLTEKSGAAEEDERVNVQERLGPRNSLLSFMRNCLETRRMAQGKDLVHAFDAWPYGVYGYCAVVGTKRRLFINGVGTYSSVPLSRPKTAWMMRLMYRRAAEVLCISNYTKERINEGAPYAKTSLMLMGTTPLPIPEASTIAALRKKLQIPENAYPILVTVGEIKERKGQMDTLKGIRTIKERYPNAFYLVVGSDTDQYAKDLQAFANQNDLRVCITANIKTDTDLSCVYSMADIFALNSNNHDSHYEGFGLVILEAAQFGVPAIGSSDCGIEDAIEDGISGVLVPQMNHEKIGEAVDTILKNHEAFKAGARAWYTRFSWEKTISVILNAYERNL